MKQLIRLIISLSLLCSTLTSYAEAEERSLPSLAPMLKKIMPAIVNVAVQGVIPGSIPSQDDDEDQNKRPQPYDTKPRKFQSIGSGVIIDPTHGMILTNEHVIRNATIITITLSDGRRLKAKLVGSDNETDVAVLQIEAKNLQSLTIGNSDNVQVGDFTVAIGNPFGLTNAGGGQSATFGIVSAMMRSNLNIEGIENFIQTDAAINPGNSGGGLVNTKGELIGINTAILSPYGGNVGIGFAIPINMAKDVAQQILRFGSVQRGLMGIFVQPLTPELVQAMGHTPNIKGALITQVNEDSPAQAAGLKAGDIIIQINDVKIAEANQVKTTVSMLRAGSDAKIKVNRNGKELSLTAVVTDVKKHEQKLQANNPFLYGLALKRFEQESPMHGHIKGVQITGASENSAGWRAGLRPGDVIVAANNQPTPDTEALQKLAQEKKEQLLVRILRGSGALYILVQ